MGQWVSSHNNKVLSTPPEADARTCDCRRGTPCFINGFCLDKNLVYKATVTRSDNNHQEFYTGVTGQTMKARYNGHTYNFRYRPDPEDPTKNQGTTLSKYVWLLKDRNVNYNITWEKIQNASFFNPATGKCRGCLFEKFFILFHPEGATLNKRSEFYNTCRHRYPLLLFPKRWKQNFTFICAKTLQLSVSP